MSETDTSTSVLDYKTKAFLTASFEMQSSYSSKMCQQVVLKNYQGKLANLSEIVVMLKAVNQL